MNKLDLLLLELSDMIKTCDRPEPDGCVGFSANYLRKQLTEAVVKLQIAHRALYCVRNSNPYPDLSDHKYRDAARFVELVSTQALKELEQE